MESPYTALDCTSVLYKVISTSRKWNKGSPPLHSCKSEEMLKKLAVQGNRMDMEERSRAH